MILDAPSLANPAGLLIFFGVIGLIVGVIAYDDWVEQRGPVRFAWFRWRRRPTVLLLAAALCLFAAYGLSRAAVYKHHEADVQMGTGTGEDHDPHSAESRHTEMIAGQIAAGSWVFGVPGIVCIIVWMFGVGWKGKGRHAEQ